MDDTPPLPTAGGVLSLVGERWAVLWLLTTSHRGRVGVWYPLCGVVCGACGVVSTPTVAPDASVVGAVGCGGVLWDVIPGILPLWWCVRGLVRGVWAWVVGSVVWCGYSSSPPVCGPVVVPLSCGSLVLV